MTRVKYNVKENGLLESQKVIKTADGRDLIAFIDTNQNQFTIFDKTHGAVAASGSGKHFKATVRAVRNNLLSLGAILTVEKRESVKQTLNEAQAVVTAATESAS